MSPWQEFRRGLTAVDARLLAAAALLFAALLTAGEMGLRRFAFCSLPEGKFLIWTYDIWSALPHRLGLMPALEGDRIVLVGSSSLYHSFYGARGLERTLREKGVEKKISLFHTPRQSLGDVLRIVENLPPGRGPLILATTSGRTQADAAAMAEEMKTSHLLLRSPALAVFLESRGAPGWRARFLLPSAVNYLRLYLSLNRRHLLAGRLPRWPLYTDRDQQIWWPLIARTPEPAPPAAVDPPLRPPSLAFQHRDRRAEHTDQLELLHAIVRAARARGYRPMLLESPLNPEWRNEYPEMAAWLRATQAALAQQEGIPYLDFFWKLNIPASDFMDSVHLKVGSLGRLRYHHALAEALIRLDPPTGALASRGAP